MEEEWLGRAWPDSSLESRAHWGDPHKPNPERELRGDLPVRT